MFALLFACCLFFSLARPIAAATEPTSQAALNLYTSPAPIDLIVAPGSTGSAELKIKNGGTEPETLKVGLMKFSAYGEDGKPRLMDREAGDNYFDWVSFSENEFAILPGEWKTITMNVRLPESAAFGYYYAVTFGRTSQAKSGQTTDISGAVAILVLVEARVSEAVRSVEVVDFSSLHKVYEFLPSTFTIKLRNSGNVHVAPRGNIFLSRGKELNLGLLEVNLESGNILPNNNRIFDAKWTDGFPLWVDKIKDDKVVLDKRNAPVQTLHWDLSQANKLRFGKYTANLLLAYDNGQRDVTIEASTSFWVIPWRLILGALAVGGLVVFGLFSSLRSFVLRLKNKVDPKNDVKKD